MIFCENGAASLECSSGGTQCCDVGYMSPSRILWLGSVFGPSQRAGRVGYPRGSEENQSRVLKPAARRPFMKLARWEVISGAWSPNVAASTAIR